MNGRSGYWRHPRWTADALDARELTPADFALIAYVGTKGDDRYGLTTTRDALASVLGVDKETISRSLKRCQEQGLMRYDLRPGQRTPFRVVLTLGAVGRVVGRVVGGDDVSQVEHSANVGVDGDRDPFDRERVVGVKTETETKNKPLIEEERLVLRTSTVDVDETDAVTDALLDLNGTRPPEPGDEPSLDDALHDAALFARDVEPFVVGSCALCAGEPGELEVVFHGARLLIGRRCEREYPAVARERVTRPRAEDA